MDPLVSILIPAHNAEKWISETIRSAINQTWARKEIIIVDDGSTDGTAAVARRYESEFVRVVGQRNQGAAAARNTAISLSHGEYIQWLDADDLLAPDKIARQLEALGPGGNRRIVLSSAWGRFLYRPHRAQFTPNALWTDLAPAEFLLHKLEKRVFMQTAVWLVSREVTEAAGPWDTNMISDDDGEYFCRILLASDGIRFVPEARVYYRVVGPSSLSYVGRSNAKLEALWGSMQLHIRYLLSLENTQRTRNACIRYLQNYLITFYPLRPDIVGSMHETAAALGGRLAAPELPWKYSWIRRLAGWQWAKRAQLLLPQLRWLPARYWDRLAYYFETKELGSTSENARS
jgi:glycosyltransferase involved in cell wall biosynthesis